MKVASVATAFPSGQSSLEIKLAEVREVVEAGVHEVDMVIDRGAFLSGRYAKVYDEVVRVKEICAGRAHLKVIIETGELGTYDNVRRASLLAIAGGADFIKTSTGKAATNATLPVALCMLEVIRDVHEETGRVVGMKVAGGIRQSKPGVQFCAGARDLDSRGSRPTAIGSALTLLNDVSCRFARSEQAATRNRITSPLIGQARDRATPEKADGDAWDYAPAPEARDIVKIQERYGCSSAGSSSSPSRLRALHDDRPGARGTARGGRHAGKADVDRAVRAARKAFTNGWSTSPSERAK